MVLSASAGCREDTRVLRIDGSPGVAPLVMALVEAHREAGGDSIALASGLGSRARLDSLQSGAIDIAMASHGLDSADLARRGLVAHEIGRTAVVFAVNASVTIGNLRPAEICDVYSGRKPAWQLFAGEPAEIVPLMRPADEVDAEVALAAVGCLQGLTFGGRVAVHERADDMARAIEETPGAIGLTSMPYVMHADGAMRALALDGTGPTAENVASGRYALTRRAFLVTHAAPAPAVAGFLAFIRSADGQRVIRESGAVPPPGG